MWQKGVGGLRSPGLNKYGVLSLFGIIVEERLFGYGMSQSKLILISCGIGQNNEVLSMVNVLVLIEWDTSSRAGKDFNWRSVRENHHGVVKMCRSFASSVYSQLRR